jgi:pilus assembly protein CpaE
VIPYDADTFVSAINLGVPPVFGATNTRVAALLEDYAFHISKEDHRKAKPRSPTEAWKRVSRRMRQHKK